MREMFQGQGEMVDLCRRHDWAATPLGPPHEWPPSLRSMVATVLNSRHPMLLLWGPELTRIYNDAWRPSLGPPGDRHPLALGQSARECLTESWGMIGPQIDQVMTQGVSTWSEGPPFPAFRTDGLERARLACSYSPVWGDAGTIEGVLVVVHETVAQAGQGGDADTLGQRLATVLESITDAFFTVDPEWRFTFVNSEGERILNRRREEVLGQSGCVINL